MNIWNTDCLYTWWTVWKVYDSIEINVKVKWNCVIKNTGNKPLLNLLNLPPHFCMPHLVCICSSGLKRMKREVTGYHRELWSSLHSEVMCMICITSLVFMRGLFRGYRVGSRLYKLLSSPLEFWGTYIDILKKIPGDKRCDFDTFNRKNGSHAYIYLVLWQELLLMVWPDEVHSRNWLVSVFAHYKACSYV
jgi:hypothetical protein